MASSFDHYVGRFQIAMDDAAVMSSRKPGRHLACDLGSLCGGEVTDPAEQRGEVFAVDELQVNSAFLGPIVA